MTTWGSMLFHQVMKAATIEEKYHNPLAQNELLTPHA
jgi:hypothetical protein